MNSGFNELRIPRTGSIFNLSGFRIPNGLFSGIADSKILIWIPDHTSNTLRGMGRNTRARKSKNIRERAVNTPLNN